jgi:hypothetical protein
MLKTATCFLQLWPPAMSLDVYKERLAVLRQKKGAIHLFGIHGYVTEFYTDMMAANPNTSVRRLTVRRKEWYNI